MEGPAPVPPRAGPARALAAAALAAAITLTACGPSDDFRPEITETSELLESPDGPKARAGACAVAARSSRLGALRAWPGLHEEDDSVSRVCAGAEPSPPAAGADCAVIWVGSNGWHATLHLPASAFAAESPARRLHPDADWIAIGWGDAQAYPHGIGPVSGLAALAWPTPSVVHAAGLDRPPRDVFGGEHRPVALSREGLARLAARIDAAFETGPGGAPIPVADGQIEGRSVFAAGAERYHGLHTCNVWTARRLREAGAPITVPARHLRPGSLLAELQAKAPDACPAP